MEHLDLTKITNDKAANPNDLGKALVPHILQDRLSIPGFEVTTQPDGSELISIDGPEVFAQTILKIIQDGKNDVASVLAELSKTGKAIRGTGFTMSANYAALLENFSSAENIRIVHVEGLSTDEREEFDGRKQTTFGLVYETLDTETDETYTALSSFTFTCPITETRLTTVDDEEFDDQSTNFSTTMVLDGLGPQEKQDYFRQHYGSTPQQSPKVRFYSDEDGNYYLDMVMGADAVEYHGLKVTPLEEEITPELVISSFKKLVNSVADNTRRGETKITEEGKFQISAWNGERETAENGVSLDDFRSMINRGCRITVR
ncbi:hypothetical protein ACFL21_01370 [Patescibacteria group bacterium]